MPTTDQVNQGNNKEGKGGFGDHPEHRNPGGWKKTQTLRYWYDFFKEMNVDDFLTWEKNTPRKDISTVASLAYQTVRAARNDLKALQEVADRSEGKAPQTINYEGGLFLDSKLEIIEADDNPEPEQETKAGPETTR